jgi:hypothetical protein
MCADAATFTARVESLSNGEVTDDQLKPVIAVPGFVTSWQTLGITTNRVHRVSANLVPPHLVDRLRRAGEEYGYSRSS